MQRIGLSSCSAGLPPGLRKTCGTFLMSSKIRGSPHKPRGPTLQVKKRFIVLGVLPSATVTERLPRLSHSFQTERLPVKRARFSPVTDLLSELFRLAFEAIGSLAMPRQGR